MHLVDIRGQGVRCLENLSNKETALLGLLMEESMYPYQMEKIIQYRDMRSWTEISMSSIYKSLAKLEERALVKSDVSISEGNRPQKFFSITMEGRTAFRAKIKDLISKPERVVWQFDLGVYYMDALEKGEIEEALGIYEEELRDLARGYGELEKFMRGEGCPEWRVAVSTRPQFFIKAELQWLRSFRSRLRRNPTSSDY
jgi:DNA-binding PadR family transcriptional regulator